MTIRTDFFFFLNSILWYACHAACDLTATNPWVSHRVPSINETMRVAAKCIVANELENILLYGSSEISMRLTKSDSVSIPMSSRPQNARYLC